MKRVSLILFVLSLSLSAQPVAMAQRKNAVQSLPPAQPFLSREICGQGVFLFSAADEQIGRETFEIRCRPDGGFSGSGNTSLKIPGGTLVQDTTIELDKAGVPQSFSVKGNAKGDPFKQSTTFKDGKAVSTAGARTEEIPYTDNGAVFVNAVAYIMQFIGARYDTERGGSQVIPLFPNMKAEMERTGRDEVRANLKSVTPTVFGRYTLNIAGAAVFTLWTDAAGRLAVIYLPSQKFAAVRAEYASFFEPLRQNLIAKVKGIVPDYSAPANAPFTAEEVTVPAKGFNLAGTLLLPKTGQRPFPAVVMSTGSGQQTRDEPALASVEKYRPFRQIAEYLAARGIAVLRADDRGVGDSGGLETLDKVTTFDFADDVRAQVAYLRTRSDIDPARISIIGHSEGGVIAPLVAASDPRLAAIVLMAGTARRGDDVLRFQFNYAAEHDPKLSAEEKAKARQETENFLRAIKENGDVSKYPLALRGLNSAWGRAFISYDPLTTIRKVRQPILILQGGLDLQVTPEQARMLEEAARQSGNKDVTVRLFLNLNHLFLPARSGEEREYASLDTYALSDEVLQAIGDWLQVKLKAGR